MAEGPAPHTLVDAVETAFEAALDGLVSDLPGGMTGAVPCSSLISAVSGGPDSMCLAVLASAYATRRGVNHRAIIIDHGVRADSAAEAARVCRRLSGLGMRAEVLTVSAAARRPAFRNGPDRRVTTSFCRQHGAIRRHCFWGTTVMTRRKR